MEWASVQLQTFLASVRSQKPFETTDRQALLRLKTSVDQMVRTRNFRVRNEVTKSQKGKKAYVEGKVGECFQWKAHGQCSKRDSCCDWYKKTCTVVRSSSPAPNSKAKTDGEGEKNPQHQATEMKALQTKGAKFRADTEIVTTRHVVLGIFPHVKTMSLRLDATMATSALFSMRHMRSPARGQRKVV